VPSLCRQFDSRGPVLSDMIAQLYIAVKGDDSCAIEGDNFLPFHGCTVYVSSQIG
jgi:hypothetical protein